MNQTAQVSNIENLKTPKNKLLVFLNAHIFQYLYKEKGYRRCSYEKMVEGMDSEMSDEGVKRAANLRK